MENLEDNLNAEKLVQEGIEEAIVVANNKMLLTSEFKSLHIQGNEYEKI